jgi:Zn-dependent peptidase ImmA (M78 family)
MTSTLDKPIHVSAEEVLDYNNRDSDGRLLLPVDPYVIAQKMGASVHRTNLPVGMSGALVREDAHNPIIFINELDSPLRQRFTVAHEVGHLAARIADGTNQSEFADIDYRQSDAVPGADQREVFANKFAAELLMPEDAVRQLARADGSSVVQLASDFAVSVQAMSIRLTNLGVKTNR